MKQALPTSSVTAGAAPKRPKGPIVIAALIAVIIAVFLLRHHENRYEKLASDVTRAIAANDMRPVAKEFNALRRPQLEDRAKVGGLSDFVNAEGAFKNVKEDTQGTQKPGYHHFVASFEKGKLAEDLTVDGDGKIADFHVHPLSSP